MHCFQVLGHQRGVVDGEGFEPSKPVATDLQSVPFDRSGTHPEREPDADALSLIAERIAVFVELPHIYGELAMGIEPAAC
jgi:hypothetical protein